MLHKIIKKKEPEDRTPLQREDYFHLGHMTSLVRKMCSTPGGVLENFWHHLTSDIFLVKC